MKENLGPYKSILPCFYTTLVFAGVRVWEWRQYFHFEWRGEKICPCCPSGPHRRWAQI